MRAIASNKCSVKFEFLKPISKNYFSFYKLLTTKLDVPILVLHVVVGVGILENHYLCSESLVVTWLKKSNKIENSTKWH